MNDQSLYLLTEAAERTGLTVEAIRQRIKRGRLEAVKGNDGLLRVRLTTADLEALDRSATGHGGRLPAGQPVNDHRLLKALQDAAEARGEAAALRERAETAEARAERAEAEVTAERVRAAKAEGESGAFREQVATERARAEAERQGRERAEAERDAARDELDGWTAGGPFERAVRAFLFRRGPLTLQLRIPTRHIF